MWSAQKHPLLAAAFLSIWGIWLLSACAQNAGMTLPYMDLIPTSRILPVTPGNYTSVAWLTKDKIALAYESSPGSTPHDRYVALYSEKDSRWEPLEKTHPKECRSVYYRQLNRLPSGGLGFLVECYTEPTGYHFYLYERTITGTLVVLYKYPDSFPAGRYSFSPDRATYLQEEYHGSKIDRLHQVKVGDLQMQQLLSEYARARSPSWSPDGRTIAFTANISIPESRLNLFSSAPGIAEVEFYPWDLYLMDAAGANVRMILPGVKQADLLKWSPLGRWLAFRGQYQDVPGIWILDTGSLQVMRVWPEQSLYYDWSPDGRQMVLLQKVTQNGKETNSPIIIDVSALMANSQNEK